MQVDRGGRPGLADVGLTDRVQRALELIGERRGVEKVERGPGLVAGAPHEPALAREIDVEAFGRPGYRLELELSSPGAHLGACPVDLGRRQTAHVELLDHERVDVFLLGAPLHRARPGAGERDQHAGDAELDGAGIELVEVRPLRGNPALVPERTELGIGAVIVEQAREKLRNDRLPARIVFRPARARAPSGRRRRSPGSFPAPPASRGRRPARNGRCSRRIASRAGGGRRPARCPETGWRRRGCGPPAGSTGACRRRSA